MQVEGIIKLIGITQEIGSGGFKKRDIVVTSNEQYPQHISVQFVQDKCELLDKFNVGENVTIGVNLRGREWTNAQGEMTYFNTIQGWKISKSETQSESAPETPTQQEDYSDLPF